MKLGRTVEELLDSITYDELIEWIAYYRLEPFGDEWLQTGLTNSTLANINRDPKKKPKPFLPQDFMPGFDKAEPKQSNAQIAANLELWKSTVNHKR